MKLEHAHLDKLWADLETEQNKKKSKRILRKFSDDLFTHIKLEDEIISPIFNKYLGIEKGKGPTTVMSSDHEKIAQLLGKVKVAKEKEDEKQLTQLMTHFRRALTSHHEKETKMQYPLFDNIISPRDWEKILEKKYHKSKVH